MGVPSILACAITYNNTAMMLQRYHEDADVDKLEKCIRHLEVDTIIYPLICLMATSISGISTSACAVGVSHHSWPFCKGRNVET